MIVYFSATGNSRWVAQQLAALTGDVLCDIADSLKEGRLPVLPDDTERVGVVFPIHSWYVPAIPGTCLRRCSISWRSWSCPLRSTAMPCVLVATMRGRG